MSIQDFQSPGATESITDTELEHAKAVVGRISDSFSSTVVGQESLLQSLLVALIANGHILLESVPGLAKTTAARVLADSIAGSFGRIQCTPDLLPSDIVGTQIYNAREGTFAVKLGPVHANFVLLDEINRSSAKTQSAMLESMQERQTSIGGEIYPLPKPFMVLATQNPIEQEGTYILPEAQMDRFLLKEVLQYPTISEELEILERNENGALVRDIEPVVTLDGVVYLQALSDRVYIDQSVKHYIVQIVNATRHASDHVDAKYASYIMAGASPRASLAFHDAARALALTKGQDRVTPDDIKALAHPILRHRLILSFEAMADNIEPTEIIDAILASIPTP